MVHISFLQGCDVFEKSNSEKVFWVLCTAEGLTGKMFYVWLHTMTEQPNVLVFNDPFFSPCKMLRVYMNKNPYYCSSNFPSARCPTSLSVSFPAVGSCVGGNPWMDQAKWKSFRARMAKSDKWFWFKTAVNTQLHNSHSWLTMFRCQHGAVQMNGQKKGLVLICMVYHFWEIIKCRKVIKRTV